MKLLKSSIKLIIDTAPGDRSLEINFKNLMYNLHFFILKHQEGQPFQE